MFIELNKIEKSFKTKRDTAPLKVLKGIDLGIEKGEMVAIKGSSGAGKSTLLHILGCLDKPTSGTYLLDGADVSKEPPVRLAGIRNKKFGFIMQHFALVEEDSALQNVAIPLLFCKTPFTLIDTRAMEQLCLLGIAHLAKSGFQNCPAAKSSALRLPARSSTTRMLSWRTSRRARWTRKTPK